MVRPGGRPLELTVLPPLDRVDATVGSRTSYAVGNDASGAIEVGRHKHAPEVQPLRYAGFWRRLAACLWDFFLFGLPYLVTSRYSLESSYAFFIAWSIGSPIVGSIGSLYLLARYGGTPGKLIQGIRVVQLDGSPITWKHALLRNSVGVLSTVCTVAVFLSVMPSIDFELVRALAPKPAEALRAYWRQIYPRWFYVLNNLEAVYILSEAVVMLTNERRRAIHDYIAGTVVVTKPQAMARRTRKH